MHVTRNYLIAQVVAVVLIALWVLLVETTSSSDNLRDVISVLAFIAAVYAAVMLFTAKHRVR